MKLRRRDYLVGAGLLSSAGLARWQSSQVNQQEGKQAMNRQPVAIFRAPHYRKDLVALMKDGLRLCGLDPKGMRVLLKPNLVEYDAATAINTDPAVLAAAMETFQSLGAASVQVGEGPGHRRDTWGLLEQADYLAAIPGREAGFVDLNRDNVSEVKAFGGKTLYLPNTALAADLIVSLPKMKTHHWAGATLSMKNFFGLVPGCVYGWPKNMLHYEGIENSIIALNEVFRKTFAIVDGIVGMEGNGPIQGRPVQSGLLVMGANLPAVDATCCRLMGLKPELMGWMQRAVHLGPTASVSIEQRGEPIRSLVRPFSVIDQFQHLRAA
jgi:uncharacterized protein (DUF362 family)